MRLIDAEMLNHVLIDFDDRPSFMCVLDEDIYDAPTVDAEPVRYGKWEKRKVKVMCPRDCWYPSTFAIDGTWNEEEGWNLEWQGEFCSNCGKQYDWQHNFCPNCGARMDVKNG